MNEPHTWLTTPEDKLLSLLSDEAKNADMLLSMSNTLRQLQAKNKFRLALLNQLLEDLEVRLDKLEQLTKGK